MLASKNLKTGPGLSPGLPLVFLHGFLGTSRDWEAVCDHLPPSSCIGFDLPGHGDSPFIEEFNIPIPRFHLIGYSMGGRIALQYAAKHPEQIASLTLLSTHPGLQTEKEKQRRLESDREWGQLLLSLPIDEFLSRWYSQSVFSGFQPDLTQRKKQNIPNLAAALLHFSLAKQPRYEIDCVIVGERDEKFRNLFKNPTLIPNAGHAIHLENPKAVAKILWERLEVHHCFSRLFI